MKRKDFIRTLSLGSAGTLVLPAGWTGPGNKKKNRIRFGIVTDVHKDIMHDADERLEAFIQDAVAQSYDFIIQLGDFCCPHDHNRGFMDIWNRFNGPVRHVIGNHDTDGGFTREQVVSYWDMPGRYYSFDQNGFHFVVLDGNETDPSPHRQPGYARYISQEQLDWLAADLAKTSLPVIVFSHQGLDNDLGGITNGTRSRLVLERANQTAGYQKVLAAFSGHQHQDYHNVINGIHYIQINSMSYQWLGDAYKHIRYSAEIDQQYPWIKYTAPFKDPLWARVDLDSRTLRVTGRRTVYVGPSPVELGQERYAHGYEYRPEISDRMITF